MAYLPDWETLAAAVARIIGNGSDEPQAKLDICNAVADKKIAVRLKVDQDDPDYAGTVLEGRYISVPTHLTPADFNWTHSRPLGPWVTGPGAGDHYSDLRRRTERRISLIELWRADVSAVLLEPAHLFLPAAKVAEVEKDRSCASPEPTQISGASKTRTQEPAAARQDNSKAGETGTELRPAPSREIDKAIGAVYDIAQSREAKPPNVNELPELVRVILAQAGLVASGRQIKDRASSQEYKNRRGRIGVRTGRLSRPSLSALSVQSYGKSGPKS